jgi:hypothetical protein
MVAQSGCDRLSVEWASVSGLSVKTSISCDSLDAKECNRDNTPHVNDQWMNGHQTKLPLWVIRV